MNILPLHFHFGELYALLSESNHSPDIIAISKSRLKASTQSIVKINLGNYCVNIHQLNLQMVVLCYT